MSEVGPGPVLQRLNPRHEAAVLSFERVNRAWFATQISDRGDDYFARYSERFSDLLDAQAGGQAAFFVALDSAGAVLGRFNLDHWTDDIAELGYRVAQRATGRGLATRCVADVCRRASGLGLVAIRAAVTEQNYASQRVLVKNGFVPREIAAPSSLGGRAGHWYQRDLVALT